MREYMDAIREPSGSGAGESAGPVMIKDRQIAPRRWSVIADPLAPVGAGAIVPLTRWLELKASGTDVSEIGACIESHEDPAVLRPHLAELPIIALRFPTWKDGRAYSQARKLRHFWGYRGVLLAHGDVLRDQILWMSRVGFDALHLRDDQDVKASLRAFSLYTSFYQY